LFGVFDRNVIEARNFDRSEGILRSSCVAAFCDHSTPAEVSVGVFFIRLCYPPAACGRTDLC
jgi:hypothetical protein